MYVHQLPSLDLLWRRDEPLAGAALADRLDPPQGRQGLPAWVAAGDVLLPNPVTDTVHRLRGEDGAVVWSHTFDGQLEAAVVDEDGTVVACGWRAPGEEDTKLRLSLLDYATGHVRREITMRSGAHYRFEFGGNGPATKLVLVIGDALYTLPVAQPADA